MKTILHPDSVVVAGRDKHGGVDRIPGDTGDWSMMPLQGLHQIAIVPVPNADGRVLTATDHKSVVPASKA